MSDGRPLRRAIREHLEYVAARSLFGLLRALPLPWSYRFVEAAFVAYYRLSSKYRERARDSLRVAFPEESDEWREELLWRSVRYQAWFFLDLLLAPSLLRSHRYRDAVDLSEVRGALDGTRPSHPGRGVVAVSGHLGAHEVGSLAAADRGWPHLVVARTVDNPLLWRWLLRQRSGYRREIVERYGALRPAYRRLKKGGTVAILIDQDAGPSGLFVPYFGRLASTHAGAATLAVLSGATVYVVSCIRTRPRAFTFEMHVTGPLHADGTANRDDETLRLTAAMTAEIERMARRFPEQALWAHRRWKTRPPRETPRDEAQG